MSKASKLYKVLMTAMIVAIAGMLLASGIIALQKSMKLNLSFNMNPNIFCRIDASIGDNTSYNTIFCNTPNNATIGAGWSGNGNTLTFTNSSTDMVKTVYLKIWNHTETRVMIETTNHTSVISAGTLATGTQGSEFSVSVPANGNASLDFSQVFAIDVSGVSHATITPQSNVYTIDGTYYVKSGATPTFAIESSEHYDELDDVTVSSTAEKSFSNGVLTLSNITGDVVVSASPIAMTYTITFNANGGTGGSTQAVQYGNTYSIPTEPTRADYTFLGWATSSGATSATWEAGSTDTQTCSGNKDWYAVWQSNNVTITFTSTTNNLQVNSINGTTITTITSLPMKKTETKNVVVTSSYGVGYWSRTANYSVTSGSATVSFDSLTGDLTITNPSGDVTIDVADHANAFKPWTYGTYVDSGASTIGTQVTYNTVYYPAFKGYKYVKFKDVDTWDPTYSSYSGAPVPLRFIIIGAGSSVSNATMLGAVQNTYVTSYAFKGTLTNAKYSNTGKNSELGDSQVLLLSEQVVDRMYYGSDYGLWTHSGSTIRIFLNGDFYTNSGLSSYASYIPTPTLKTAWRYHSGTNYGATYNSQKCVEDTSSKIFVLASRNGKFTSGTSAANGIHVTNTNTSYQTVKYGYQNYCVEDYLGTSDATFTFKVPTETSFSGGNCTYEDAKLKSIAGMYTSSWWLRSGVCDDTYYAYFVNYSGAVYGSVVNYNNGVRPSFILDISNSF